MILITGLHHPALYASGEIRGDATLGHRLIHQVRPFPHDPVARDVDMPQLQIRFSDRFLLKTHQIGQANLCEPAECMKQKEDTSPLKGLMILSDTTHYGRKCGKPYNDQLKVMHPHKSAAPSFVDCM